MARILKNKTAEDVNVSYGTITVVIEASSQRDISETFEYWQLASSTSLIELLGQGVDKYQLNDGTNDLSVTDALSLVLSYSQKYPLAEGGELLVDLDTPKTSDGKNIFLPNLFPGDVYPNYPGVGDNIETGARYGGSEFSAHSTTSETKSVEWQFKEWLYLAGAELIYKGATYGDYCNYTLYAPVTVGTSNPGAGHYNKQGGIFIPAVNGDWDLDLTEKLSANVQLTKVVPVPATEGTGFFNWDDATEAVTVVPNRTGNYHLLYVPVTLAQYVAKVRMLGDGHVVFHTPAVKPKKCLGHWKHKVDIYNSSEKILDVVWFFFVARKNIA